MPSDPEMHVRQRVEPDSRMPVMTVVCLDKSVHEISGVCQRSEPLGDLRKIFQRLGPALPVRVVIADLRPRMRLEDIQVRQQRGHRLRGHRGAAIGVHHQRHLVGGEHLGDELTRQFTGLAGMDLAADNVARVDVDHHVRVVVGALVGPANLVMSHLNTSPGWFATNAGIFRAG